MAETDTPPRTRRKPTEPGASPKLNTPESEGYTPRPPGTAGTKVLEKKLETMVASLALPFAAAGDIHCASLVATRAPAIAEAWANLAGQSPPVRRALESMLKGGAWAGAIGTTLPVFVGIAAHHGMIPAQYANPINSLIFGPGSMPAEDNGTTEQTTFTGSENGGGTTPFTGTGFPPPPDTYPPVA